MAKPSEEIQEKLHKFMDANPDIKQQVMDMTPEGVAVASAAMIQAILEWLDENFKPSV